MSSTILHASQMAGAEDAGPEKNPFLVALGERVRALRSRRGMTRKAVAVAADVSERLLANLEYGSGNASILVLLQVAGALQCSLAELLGDVTTSSPEWLLLRELLERQDEDTLRHVRVVHTRLPRMATDQTASIMKVSVAPSLQTMLDVVRAMQTPAA